MRYVIDTNIWIRLLRKERKVRSTLEAVLKRGDEIFIASIVYFELLRGLQARNDTVSIQFIQQLLTAKPLVYQECSKPIWDKAIDLWVSAEISNKARGDADILIAAFATQLGAKVVTENAKHFSHLGVAIENWN
jgi:predicted nucleic acid-binding protein